MRIFFARFPGANNPCQGEPKRGTSDEGSCVLSTPLFTRFGLVVMTSIYDWVMKDDDEMQGWQRAAGPMVFLIGMAVCVLSIWVTGNEIGEISCRFRLSYSPGNGAFAIWSVLFPWHFVSVFVQFLANFYPESLYSARFEANLLMGLAWVASGAWVAFFTSAKEPDSAFNLGFAALALLVAMATAFSAVFLEQGFRETANAAQILSVSVPFSLLAAWLAVAASISIGIFLKSVGPGAGDLECVREPGSREPLVPEPSSWLEASAPLWVSLCVAIIALVQFDIVVVLPIAWAVVFMKDSLFRTASLTILSIGEVAVLVMFVSSRT